MKRNTKRSERFSPRRRAGYDAPRRLREREREAVEELGRVREPLFRELTKLVEHSKLYVPARPVAGGESDPGAALQHHCCQREMNQMRISPLEAKAIAIAFRTSPTLRAALPAVLDRLQKELPGLTDGEERQNFDCPLLEGTRCLVHDIAKPIGCTAWNAGRDFSKAGWKAFEQRDRLNDRLYGSHWKLRVIPLWLKRVLRKRSGK